jgi:predicted type IV restriction endonuclease
MENQKWTGIFLLKREVKWTESFPYTITEKESVMQILWSGTSRDDADSFIEGQILF